MSDYKAYSEVDNNGLFIGVRSALNKDRDTGEWLQPSDCYDIEPPVKQEGLVAVLSDDKKSWIYKDDNSGTWFDVDERKEVIIDYPLSTITDNYIKTVLNQYESYNKETKEITFNLIEYKKDKIKEVSLNCNSSRVAVLDDTKILNILSGATLGYPDYLTPSNVAKMIELFKNIYHTYSNKIQTAETKDEVDGIINEIVYPSVEYILKTLSN